MIEISTVNRLSIEGFYSLCTRAIGREEERLLSQDSVLRISELNQISLPEVENSIAQLFLSILGSQTVFNTHFATRIPINIFCLSVKKCVLFQELFNAISVKDFDAETLQFKDLKKEEYPALFEYVKIEKSIRALIRELIFALPTSEYQLLQQRQPNLGKNPFVQEATRELTLEIDEGAGVLYNFLKRPRILTNRQQLLVLKVLFKGSVAGDYTFLDALLEWREHCAKSRTRVEALLSKLPLSRLFLSQSRNPSYL